MTFRSLAFIVDVPSKAISLHDVASLKVEEAITYVYIYIHIHIYIYTHIYIYNIYTYVCFSLPDNSHVGMVQHGELIKTRTGQNLSRPRPWKLIPKTSQIGEIPRVGCEILHQFFGMWFIPLFCPVLLWFQPVSTIRLVQDFFATAHHRKSGFFISKVQDGHCQTRQLGGGEQFRVLLGDSDTDSVFLFIPGKVEGMADANLGKNMK